MSKEMYISSSLHETKLAVVEDDQLVEVYFERDTDVGLVGGIYKGRVSRVLPGMQSAFVDIGLDRDAFLYVSDFFFEDQEDYDKILDEAEACAVGFNAEPAQAAPVAAPPLREQLKNQPPRGPLWLHQSHRYSLRPQQTTRHLSTRPPLRHQLPSQRE